MTEELICENCGCPFLCQEDDGYYFEDCERYYSFYDAFALMGLQEYRKEEKEARIRTAFLSFGWVVRWDT